MMLDGVSPEVIDRARRVQLVALDVDGVLTDGSLYYSESGESLKRFHVKDGHGIRLLTEAGYQVAIVSARGGAPLRRRLADLGVKHLLEGVADKGQALSELARTLGVELAATAYLGDDLVDLLALDLCGLAASVADAHPLVKKRVHYVTHATGGNGAVRELADLLLEASRGSSAVAAATPSQGFGVIIPARFGSTRLLGKPLREIAGKPMVLHVCENAKASGARFVLVATDDARIVRAVEGAGFEAMLTSPEHRSGSDRLAEVVKKRGGPAHEVLVNVQGDEPLLAPEHIALVGNALGREPLAEMATLAAPITDERDWLNPHVVKVVTNRAGFALYFSRASIPFLRDPPAGESGHALAGVSPLRHIGIYAYRASALLQIASQPPVAAEISESLEQLRALWLGIGIHVSVVDEAPAHGVDTESDLLEAAERLARLTAKRAAASYDT